MYTFVHFYLQPGVIDDIYLTSQIALEWTFSGLLSPDIVRQAVWHYIGTATGVVRIFPGVQESKYYDPRARPWYQKAVANPGTVAITSPYLDALGGGHVITLSQSIQQTGCDTTIFLFCYVQALLG